MTQILQLVPLARALQHQVDIGQARTWSHAMNSFLSQADTKHDKAVPANRKNVDNIVVRLTSIRNKLGLNNRELVAALNENGYPISYHNFQRQIQGNSTETPIRETFSHVQSLYKKLKEDNLINEKGIESQLRIWFNILGLQYSRPGVRSRSLKELAEQTGTSYNSLWRWRRDGSIPFSAATIIDQKVKELSSQAT